MFSEKTDVPATLRDALGGMMMSGLSDKESGSTCRSIWIQDAWRFFALAGVSKDRARHCMPDATLSFGNVKFYRSAIYYSVMPHDNAAMNIQSIRRARLAQLIRDRFDGSQAKFVETTGENQGEVSALLRDKSFGEKKARKIESKCGLPHGWLDTIEGDSAAQSQSQAGSVASAPIGRWIAVGGIAQGKPDGGLTVEPYPPGEDGRNIYAFCSDNAAYALRMHGDGMRPRIKHAEYIVVETCEAPQPGDDVLVTRRDGGRLIRELLWMRDGELYLGSINHHSPPVTLLSNDIDSVHRIAAIVPRGSAMLRKNDKQQS